MNYEFNSMKNYLHLHWNNHGKDEKTEINFNSDVLAAAAVIVCILGSFSNYKDSKKAITMAMGLLSKATTLARASHCFWTFLFRPRRTTT